MKTSYPANMEQIPKRMVSTSTKRLKLRYDQKLSQERPLNSRFEWLQERESGSHFFKQAKHDNTVLHQSDPRILPSDFYYHLGLVS